LFLELLVLANQRSRLDAVGAIYLRVTGACQVIKGQYPVRLGQDGV